MKKTAKSVISFLLALIMLLCSVPAFAADEAELPEENAFSIDYAVDYYIAGMKDIFWNYLMKKYTTSLGFGNPGIENIKLLLSLLPGFFEKAAEFTSYVYKNTVEYYTSRIF